MQACAASHGTQGRLARRAVATHERAYLRRRHKVSVACALAAGAFFLWAEYATLTAEGLLRRQLGYCLVHVDGLLCLHVELTPIHMHLCIFVGCLHLGRVHDFVCRTLWCPRWTLTTTSLLSTRWRAARLRALLRGLVGAR